MKKFILSLVLLFSLTMYPNQTTKDSIQESTTAQEVERLVDKYGGKIVDGFNHVVEKATPVAEQGFKIAVRLNIAHGIACMLPLVFLFLFMYWFMEEYNRLDNILKSNDVPRNMNYRYGPMYEDNITPKLIMNIIATIIMFILVCIFTVEGIKHLIAPEWYAIKDIIDLFK